MTINSSFYQDKLMSWLTSGGRALYSTIGIMVSILITPIFAFYFLLEADKIREKWPSILPLKASKFRKDVVDTMEEINGYLISFFRGQMLVSIIEGILIAICLKLLGLPYAVTIGAAVCVLGIVPYLGIITAFIPAGVAIRDGINGLGAKMTKSPEGGSLFDLEKDPKELNNVAAQHPDICEQMKAKLQEIRQRPETKADRADLLPLDD